MIKSMTGFGRAFKADTICDIRVEIKCVNSKYCDIFIRLPKVLTAMEIPLRAQIQDALVRGKADVSIDVRFTKPVQTPVLNRQQFISSLNVLEQMKVLGGLQDDIQLQHLLGFQDLIEYDLNPDLEQIEKLVHATVAECLTSLDSMRAAEGKNLQKAIIDQLSIIDGLAQEVDSAKNDVFLYWLNRFQGRLKEFAPEITDNDRIVQEASIYAEKADIKEELTRIYSHHKQFFSIMKDEFPCGKKLDFLCQEMYREWNTIASKSLKADIISRVVEAKAAVDSVREQIQNVI